MKERKNRLPVKGKFGKQVEIGEQLKAAGATDFESVYGSKTPGAFNFQQDVQETNASLGITEQGESTMTTKKTIERKKDSKAAFTMPDPNAKLPQDMPVSALGPDNEEQEEVNEEQEEEKELTIEEKCTEISKFIETATGSAPDAQLVLSWKQQHGDLFVLPMGEKVYVFRYLKRQELIQMKANPSYDQLTESQREEDIYHRCVLYPSTDALQEASDPAGLMGMLAQQIKMQSMFLDENYIAQLVIKI